MSDDLLRSMAERLAEFERRLKTLELLERPFDISIEAVTAAGALTMGNYNLTGAHVALDDDEATSFTVEGTRGAMFLYGTNASYTTLYALVSWRTLITEFCEGIILGTNVETTTGVLNGTTGNDTKFTISAHTDEKLYLENRMGGTRGVSYILFGGA